MAPGPPRGDIRWEKVNDLGDVPSQLLDEIEHFFEVYKMLEPDKHSTTREWGGAAEAWKEIEASRARYPG